MSHKATNWAIQRRGLRPATKLVLLYLCDRHNPDFGCFPRQSELADDAEISVSTLNVHLIKLEEAGLIRRVQSIDSGTKRQRPTRYILGFEHAFAQGPSPVSGGGLRERGAKHALTQGPTPETGGGLSGTSAEHVFTQGPTPEAGDGLGGTGAEHFAEPTPEIGDGADSGFCEDPTPDSTCSRLRNPESIKESVREEVREEEERASAHPGAFLEFFEELLRTVGVDADRSFWWRPDRAMPHVQRWCDEHGISPAEVIAVAKGFVAEMPEPPNGPKAMDAAMARFATKKQSSSARTPRAGKKRKSEKEHQTAPQFYADWVNSDKHLPSSAISQSICEAMLAAHLVTRERLAERLRG